MEGKKGSGGNVHEKRYQRSRGRKVWEEGERERSRTNGYCIAGNRWEGDGAVQMSIMDIEEGKIDNEKG
jgi:hypothetical protein